MATKFTYDTANKVFQLNAGVTTLDATSDFYAWVKYDWLTTDALRKFKFPIDSIAGNDIGGGNKISPYYALLYGWRIRFAPADQTLTIIGNVITAEGDPPMTDNPGPYHHEVNYQVSSNSLTVGLEGDIAALPAAVWDDVIEGGFTARQLQRIMAAALAGKLSGAESATIEITGVDGTTTRIQAVGVDDAGNRPTVNLDGD